ncbi:hypothetical protein CP532_4885, partial [Ophiocordyceps camponoti-leonardi (nom. inval.)]
NVRRKPGNNECEGKVGSCIVFFALEPTSLGARYGNPPSMSQDRDLTWPASASFAIDGVYSGAGEGHASTGTRDRRHARDTTATRNTGIIFLLCLTPTQSPGGTRCRPSARPPARSWACQRTYVHISTALPYLEGTPSKPPIMCPPSPRPAHFLFLTAPSLVPPLSLLHPRAACQIRISSCAPDPPIYPRLESRRLFIRRALRVRERRQKKARLTPFGSLQPGSPPPPISLFPAPLFSLLRPSAWEIRAPLTDRTQGATRSL